MGRWREGADGRPVARRRTRIGAALEVEALGVGRAAVGPARRRPGEAESGGRRVERIDQIAAGHARGRAGGARGRRDEGHRPVEGQDAGGARSGGTLLAEPAVDGLAVEAPADHAAVDADAADDHLALLAPAADELAGDVARRREAERGAPPLQRVSGDAAGDESHGEKDQRRPRPHVAATPTRARARPRRPDAAAPTRASSPSPRRSPWWA